MADDSIFIPSSLAALAPKPTSSAALVAVCTWVLSGAGAWECVLPRRGGQGGKEATRRRAAATGVLAAVFVCMRQLGDELALV